MEINVVQGAIQNSQADTIVVNLFAGVTQPGGATGALDQALDGAVSDLIAGGDFRGKQGDVAVLYPRREQFARRVLIVGLGQREKFDLEGARQAAAAALKKARALKTKSLATIVHGAGIGGLDTTAAAQAVVEASLLAHYRYDDLKKKDEDRHDVASLTIMEFDQKKIEAVKAGATLGQAVAAGVALARDLTNMPPNVATPTKMADVAADIAAAHGMALTVGDREWAAEHKMGAFLAVAKGAGEPPKFIVLEHNAGRDDLETIVLVGKGITFDTGGISIKPTERMGDMKADMAGAAAVLGAMKTVGLLDLPLRVVAITPCTENMPDANAYRPADVITAGNDKTIEIISTDAEGRLVLADALVYAGRYQPAAVVNLATLTGACIVALGRNMAAGLFSNDNALRDRLVAAAELTHERVWPMPLWEDYREAIKSDVADIKNSGGRWGGLASSAIFLEEFVDYPWAHLDIAGMPLMEKEKGYYPVGGTGYGARLLVQFLREWEERV